MRPDLKTYCRELLFNGFTVQYKDVIICDLDTKYARRFGGKEYQVYSNHTTEVYKNIDDAIADFEQLSDACKK